MALVVGRGFNVELGRVDTIPSGNATIAGRGAETSDVGGRALFGYEQIDDYAPVLAIETGPTVLFVRHQNTGNPIVYTVTGGTLRIEHSNRSPWPAGST